jgi:hypothetical protein
MTNHDPDKVREAAPDLFAAVLALLEWERHMGGWESPAWKQARDAARKAGADIEPEPAPEEDDE